MSMQTDLVNAVIGGGRSGGLLVPAEVRERAELGLQTGDVANAGMLRERLQPAGDGGLRARERVSCASPLVKDMLGRVHSCAADAVGC